MELVKEIVTRNSVKVEYPKDWGNLNLGQSAILKARIGWQGLTTAEYLKIGDYYLITGTDFKGGYIDWDNCVYVEKLRFDQDKNIQVKIGDVLVTKDGTIGKVAYVDKVPKDTTLNSGVFVIRPINNSYHPRYFYYVLMSEHFKQFLGKLTAGSTISHLYQKDFVHYDFPLPPTLTEQKAIATALSDVDDLIANLDKLITKKNAIKQGAMQQLLTPNEKWINTSLIELAGNKKNQFDDGDWIESEYIISQGVRLIQTGNIGIGVFKDKGNKKYISEESFNKLNCKEVLKGDLLICRLAEPAGRACVMPSIGEDKVVTSVDVSIFRGNPEIVNKDFLSQLFTTNGWFQKVIEKVGGTTHKRISRGALGKINIEVPLIVEQKRIALVLSDMDTEIEQLELKKAKCQDIKQGMMQELLTGKTRLV